MAGIAMIRAIRLTKPRRCRRFIALLNTRSSEYARRQTFPPSGGLVALQAGTEYSTSTGGKCRACDSIRTLIDWLNHQMHGAYPRTSQQCKPPRNLLYTLRKHGTQHHAPNRSQQGKE